MYLFYGEPLAKVENTLNLNFVSNDTLPKPPFAVKDYQNQVVDITGYSFELHLGYATPVSVSGSITDAVNGEFTFDFALGDLHTDVIDAEVQVTDAGGQIRTFQDIRVTIMPEIM